MGFTIRRCECCHFPITGNGVPVCRQCVMIADGETYGDGSSPAEGLSHGEIVYVGTRVRSIRNAHAYGYSHVATQQTVWLSGS